MIGGRAEIVRDADQTPLHGGWRFEPHFEMIERPRALGAFDLGGLGLHPGFDLTAIRQIDAADRERRCAASPARSPLMGLRTSGENGTGSTASQGRTSLAFDKTPKALGSASSLLRSAWPIPDELAGNLTQAFEVRLRAAWRRDGRDGCQRHGQQTACRGGLGGSAWRQRLPPQPGRTRDTFDRTRLACASLGQAYLETDVSPPDAAAAAAQPCALPASDGDEGIGADREQCPHRDQAGKHSRRQLIRQF